MKIGIDARMIGHSGIGTVLRNLISRLPAISAHDYVLFGDKAKLERYGIPVIGADFPIYGLKEQIVFPDIIKKARVNLFHSPHYVIPLMYAGKIVVTVNDLNHLLFPEYLSSKLAYYYAKFMLGAACKKSANIITISENTRKDIIRFFNPPESKIDVVSLGVDESFRPGVAGGDNAPRKKYGGYLLYVGLIRPHKNILRLIDAFAKLKKQGVIGHKLILIG
ncbi:MAG: glycosyltransferase, partial [Endomicrobiia bacterium]|nr:glycosyltransferase [Endomicrobiia bacterium]